MRRAVTYQQTPTDNVHPPNAKRIFALPLIPFILPHSSFSPQPITRLWFFARTESLA